MRNGADKVTAIQRLKCLADTIVGKGGQGGIKTAATAAIILRMVNSGLNEIYLERKDPVPNYLFFGEQK